jgi:predicted Rossmann-fold nucleotide-binding protein
MNHASSLHGVHYETPETPDGVVRKVQVATQGTPAVHVEIEFRLGREFRERAGGDPRRVAFAARSRIARLGIDVEPTGPITFENGRAMLAARLSANVREYGLDRFLHTLIVPGIKLGRLVLVREQNQLTPEQIYASLERNEFQLPSGFSIDAEGAFTIRTHKLRYVLSRELTEQDALAILTQDDGKSILNRMQVPKPIENLVIPAGHGVITSCSMFLHKHYVVIDPDAGALGRHLNAIVLDPVSTRGTRVFLEISNSSDRQIVNPFVKARIYAADERSSEPRVFATPRVEETGITPAAAAQPADAELPTYEQVSSYYARHMPEGGERSYQNRPLLVVNDFAALAANRLPELVSTRPAGGTRSPASLRTTLDYSQVGRDEGQFATRILAQLPEGRRATLLVEYFPNLIEHIAICNAILTGRIGTLIFRRASFEHGQFFSANDHVRLADYEALGARVVWCSEDRRHLAVHAFRGLRGYFVQPSEIQRFKNTLVLAVYGSAERLLDPDVAGLHEFLAQVKQLFGGQIAILTGGGPGAMQQATDSALEHGLLVGANYIETIDQGTNKVAHFYQCFQDRNRHNRQRWFDIASFVVFCVGGLGTLEEVGLTMTDMKLGMVERGPVVFFGKHGDDVYWSHMKAQLERMVEARRAPAWINENVLFTGDARHIAAFYKKVLGLG